MDDDYIAYCLNQAVYYFGRVVEQMMDDAASRAKNEKAGNAAREQVLKRVLNPSSPTDSKATGFADPADMFK